MHKITTNFVYVFAAGGIATAIGAGAFLLSASMPTTGIAADKTIRGNVIYRERIALPPEASLTVQLTDTSTTDATARIISETTISDIVGAPIPFVIEVDGSKLKSGHDYALQARISTGDTLWFVNDTREGINTDNLQKPYDVHVVMVRTGSAAVAAPVIFGPEWQAETIDNADVLKDSKSTLTISETGDVNGSAGCNRYFGKAETKTDKISFGPLGATYMMCPSEVMDQERKFLDALEKTKSYRFNLGKLILLDEQGKEIMQLTQGAG